MSTDRPEASPISAEELAVMTRVEAGELLSAAELAIVLRYKHAHFGRLERAGAFDQFKVHPPIGTRRYSGVLVRRYLCGEPLEGRSFGLGRRRA